MLIDWAYGKPRDEEKAKLLAALGVKDGFDSPAWPLPNMKPSTEGSFWGWNASYSPRARIYLGHKKVNDEPATVLLYWMGETHPSFAVAVVYRNTCAHHPVYFTWTACEHDYQIVDSGNCWRDYKCTKCGVGYHEDSSG